MFELPEYVTLCRQINDTLQRQDNPEGRVGKQPPQIRLVQ